MRILFIHNHREFAPPFLRSIPALREHGIDVTECKTTSEQQAIDCKPAEYDAILMQEPPVFESVLDCGRPVILLERVDGAQLRAARQYLPRVAGVIKSYVFRDRADYNTIYDRAHVTILAAAGVFCSRPLHQWGLPEPLLSDESLSKIRVGYSGLGCHAILGESVNSPIDFDAERSCDVHFAGTVDYEDTEVDAHRRLALQAAQTWPGASLASAGRSIQRPEYNRGIRNSKTVLCPWGWGESSYRDYEAMALGAVVIKPDTSHVESSPDIYREGETYVPCRPDFADAHEKIALVKEHWADFRGMRERARALVVEAWQPETIATHMAATIKELVG